MFQDETVLHLIHITGYVHTYTIKHSIRQEYVCINMNIFVHCMYIYFSGNVIKDTFQILYTFQIYCVIESTMNNSQKKKHIILLTYKVTLHNP